jgi:hypothetical protein
VPFNLPTANNYGETHKQTGYKKGGLGPSQKSLKNRYLPKTQSNKRIKTFNAEILAGNEHYDLVD